MGRKGEKKKKGMARGEREGEEKEQGKGCEGREGRKESEEEDVGRQ